jgi:hypothetical protein
MSIFTLPRSIAFAVGLTLSLGLGILVGQFSTTTASAAPATSPVPVIEQNLDANGLIRVHEQGTVPISLPVLQPVQKTAFGSFAAGDRFSSTINLFTVPAGKTLVIQTVTIESNLSSTNEQLLHVLVNAQSGDVIPFTISVQPVAEGLFTQTGANVFRKTATFTIYAGPGTTVSATGTRDGTDVSFSDSLGVGIAGYLVDAP